jgi:DNA-binding FadR family transcriptional regulator
MHQVDSDLAFHQAIAEAAHNVIVGHLDSKLACACCVTTCAAT